MFSSSVPQSLFSFCDLKTNRLNSTKPRQVYFPNVFNVFGVVVAPLDLLRRLCGTKY